MFIGEFHLNIDDKGRLFIPSEFRKILGEEIVINRGIEQCIYVYPTLAWSKIVSKLSSLSFTKKTNREFNRMFLSGAFMRSIDSKGRINVENILIEYAGISKECIILGVGERLEIWDKNIWTNYYNERKAVLEDISEQIEFDIE